MGGSGSGTPLSQAGSGVATQQQQQQPLSAAASGGSGSNTPHPSAVPPPQQPGQGMPIHSPMLPPGGNVQRSFSPYNIPPGQHVDPHQMAIMQQQQVGVFFLRYGIIDIYRRIVFGVVIILNFGERDNIERRKLE